MKTKKIEALEKKRDKMAAVTKSKIAEVDESLRTEYYKLFKKKLKYEIADTLKFLSNSNDYSFDQTGYVVRWTRASKLISLISEDSRGFFEEYLNDLGNLCVDWDNETVYELCGPEIIIYEDGDVLDRDSDKWIIKRTDYETEEERNTLIEQYMEKTGYYPGVFKADRYGNLFPVSTQSQK